MAEHFLGTQQVQEAIRQQLVIYRQAPEQFVQQSHPQMTCVSLEQLIREPMYASSIDQPLLRFALERLPDDLCCLPGCQIFEPTRVWVGMAAPRDAGWFGGFHHIDQGYRYLQQLALTSLSGMLTPYAVPETLRTLELLRAYIHDTIHAATYRLFCPVPSGASSDLSFYRLQYGMNFRRWYGQSYSEKDNVRSSTTRNLGTIMEAATDRFAQECVLALAQQIGYHPPVDSLVETWLYRECTGQLTEQDILLLRSIERGEIETHVPVEFKVYLRQMRLFVQYVTMRYRVFLGECGADKADELHWHLLQATLSGKLRKLLHFLDALRGQRRSFVTLFKAAAY